MFKNYQQSLLRQKKAMAIDLLQFNQIVKANVKGRALSAGYPDLLVRFTDLPEMGMQFMARKDSAVVEFEHGWRYPIADTVEVFAAMGIELEVIDREKVQGCERIVDLNEPIPFNAKQFDLVIDPGTSEHCFNIAQALVNLASVVKVGGVISQALPMAMFNHGYWNVNPVALLDFYETNGFRIEECVIRHDKGVYKPVARHRYMAVPDGSVTCILARRLEAKPFVWPQQQPPTDPPPQ